MRTRATLAATLILIASLIVVSGSALAQIPDPTNNLGVSENDVRPEPNHPDDANNFTEADPFRPKGDHLILEGYAESRYGSDIAFSYDEDTSNIANVLMHGQNTDNYEQYMLPGKVTFEAYWGWWSDTGSGGSLQANDATSDQFGAPNGVIDDANDCSETSWDEFHWRGPNNKCAQKHGFETHKDNMWGFVQPGTHQMQVNTLVLGCSCPEDALLRNGSDRGIQPDFEYGNNPEAGGQEWIDSNGFGRYVYDQSLLISSQVTTSVNPKEIFKDLSGREFLPQTGASDAIHHHDVDVYSSIHPAVEDAYRTAVWDPKQDYGDGEDETNPFPLGNQGLKEWLKEPFHTQYQEAQQGPTTEVFKATEPTEPQQGLAEDVVFGPYFHEPNTAKDDFTVDTTPGKTGGDFTLATFGPKTTYGGLDGDYYEPGPGQTYPGYQTEEHFWMDARVGVNTCPIWIPSKVIPGQDGTNCYNGWGHVTPELPSTGSPAQSIAQEDDDNTFGPTVLYWTANAGTWHDKNGDTWIGNASDHPDDGYDNGMDQDPNNYGSDEFRGATRVTYDVQLVPTQNTDADPQGEWGQTGVYVMGTFDEGNPYSDAAMDVAGDNAEPVLGPARDNPTFGPSVSYIAPDDENGQFSRYRTDGPIDLGPVRKPGGGAGTAFSGRAVVFPVGSLDVPFKVVTTAELDDPDRQSKAPGNKPNSLTGEAIRDVDLYKAVLETG